jgi:hypothetical protein
MASINYNALFKYMANGSVLFDGSHTLKAMLLTSTYSSYIDKDHDYVDDVKSYEVTGTGYTEWGNACTPTVDATDNANDKQTISFSITSWTSSTITARYCVIYRYRGTTASANELVCCLDFGSNQSSSSGTFAVSVTSPLTIQN